MGFRHRVCPNKARAAIFLFMYGGPSHVDLFDEKPALAKWHGKAIPVWKESDAFNREHRSMEL
jgi:uncharacterized protein DUF1501